jgi:hypothetical protein
MISPNSSPLKIGALGLDARAINLFRMFLRGPCHNQAVIVEGDDDAEAYLIDLDTLNGHKLLAHHRETFPDHPYIVLSLKHHPDSQEHIFVQKPAKAPGLLSAIAQAKAKVLARMQPVHHVPVKPAPSAPVKVVTAKENTDGSVHKVAMLLDEQRFNSYLGSRPDIDPSNPAQLQSLFYEPREYLQGHIERACQLALASRRAIAMETPWKTIIVLPEQRLIRVDADEAQLRAACGIPFRKITSLETGADLDQSVSKISELDDRHVAQLLEEGKCVSLDGFVWKVALWSSKGRIPWSVDIRQQAYLIRWPNFPRLLITPHAMRIAALLHQKPCNLFEAARALGIRQQYVFAFFSAAFAQGLTETRPVPDVPKKVAESTPQPEKAARNSLLRKILNRLKMI